MYGKFEEERVSIDVLTAIINFSPDFVIFLILIISEYLIGFRSENGAVNGKSAFIVLVRTLDEQ